MNYYILPSTTISNILHIVVLPIPVLLLIVNVYYTEILTTKVSMTDLLYGIMLISS